MTRSRQRVVRLEAQRRPAYVAALLVRLRAGDPATWQSRCLDALTTLSRQTATALMEQCTDAEWEAVCDPQLCGYLDAMPDADLAALIRGDPTVTRRVQQWIRDASTTAKTPDV